MGERIKGLHHITLCTGTAQADVDFFVKVIGQRLVKRTLFYDGREPIYHLYFADETGSPGTVMTTFPMRRTGIRGRKGSGQFSAVAYSVPRGSLDFWGEHLERNRIQPSPRRERFGQALIGFEHPGCGIAFELVEDGSDRRAPWKSAYVPEQFAVRGFHNWSATVREMDDFDGFLKDAWEFTPVGRDGKYTRYQIEGGGAARLLDVLHEPGLRQGSWTVGEGTIHHGAFDVPDLETQASLKFDVEGMGFTDFSDSKNRGYFYSIYVRTPGGVMFEGCVSLGFTRDESQDRLGEDLKLSPQFSSQKDELLRKMQDPIVI